MLGITSIWIMPKRMLDKHLIIKPIWTLFWLDTIERLA